MTPEKQRIAIAEVCGWGIHHSGKYVHPTGERWRNLIVDPLDDLNARHEMENWLSDKLYGDFISYLKSLYYEKTRGLTCDGMVSATATQRCEAFLRTIGKWEDAQ